jgi:ABC-2 type transport system ATP-binding protein
MTTSKPVASLQNLIVRYGRTVAVNDVSLDVPSGSVYALLGRNGAGKSSMIRCLLGQWKPSGGTARIFGRDVWRDRVPLMVKVGVVPERPEVPPSMTVEHLARFSAGLYATWDQAAFDERIRRFAVPRRHPFGKMSKGQQRQASLALALASSPELLVLDDPTLGLDAVARRELLDELIVELADRGTTVFAATNDISGFEGVADRVGVLSAGRLVVDESVEALKTSFRRIRAKDVDDWRPSDDVTRVIDSRRVAGGVEAIVRGGADGPPVVVGDSIDVTPMTLEQIFVALCGSAGEEAA